jgi:capsular exopolysaccharide synthesis family protein
MANTQSTIDMHQYWGVLRARKLTVIITTLAAIGLAAAYIVLQKPQYTAQAKVLVNPLLSPVAASTPKSNLPDMNTEQATADSTPIANLARAALKLPSNDGTRLLSHLNVTAATTGNILQFQYTAPDAQQAAQYVNAFAQAYVTYRNDTVLKLLAAAVAERQHTIAVLEEQLRHAGSAQRAATMSQLHDDEVQLATFQSDQSLVDGAQVIGTAVPPSKPSGKKTTTLIIAAVIGLVLGILLALIREAMDRRIKSPGELGNRLQAPVLGVIPKFRERSPDRSLVTVSEPRGSASEAYRTAAIALETLAARAGARVIMFASPREGGGATTTLANVGVVLAQAGHQVLLVSADLRDPTLHHILGLQNGRGLSTAVLEGKNIERLLKGTRIPNLFLLNAGPEPEDPAALLSSPGTAQVFDSLLALKPDFILVDAPPVLSVSDAMILSRQVDGTVVTWNAEDFKAPALDGTRDRLDQAGANILGAIYSFDSGKRKGGRSQLASGPPAQPAAPFDRRQTAVSAGPAEESFDRIDPVPPRDQVGVAPSGSRASGRISS